jgi:two-component system, LytTR family, response regulator
MRTIRTILVDDEPLAIQGLELRLQAFDDIEIIDRARSGREAIRAIKTHKPDLVFLDIQMPGFDGFGVISGLADIELPVIVFVTAYDDFAVKAFEAQALDYLLKPVEESRLAQTVARVREQLFAKAAQGQAQQLRGIVQQLAPDAARAIAVDAPSAGGIAYEKVINVKDRGQIYRVPVDDIERIDAAGDYMCLHIMQGQTPQTLILRETMKDLEKRLDPKRFRRVHRSTIVNLDRVKEIKPHTNGECFLVLSSSAQIKVSRSYRDVVARFM